MQNFLNEQPLAFNLLNSQLKSNRIANAYLIDDNGTKQGFEIACSFCEALIENKIELTENVEIIECEGISIKKEQIDNLKRKFATKAIIGEKKVYIIKNAEKLGASSANALLKFLEEPEPNIYAILVTENINQVLETIKSRCLIIPLIYKEKKELSTLEKIKKVVSFNEIETLQQEQLEEFLEFLEYVDKNKLKTMLYLKKISKTNKFDKNDAIKIFNIFLLFYKDVLEYKTLQQISIFEDYITKIKTVSFNNTDEQIVDKIKLLIEVLDDLKYNVNVMMEYDKFIMRMEEI